MDGKLPRDLGVILIGFYVYEIIYDNDLIWTHNDIFSEMFVVINSILLLLLIHTLMQMLAAKTGSRSRKIVIGVMAVSMSLLAILSAFYSTGVKTGVMFGLGFILVLSNDFIDLFQKDEG